MSKKSGGKFRTFFFGGLIGFIAGLAYAPRPGTETRELWKEKSEDLKEKVDDLKKKAQELLDKLEEAWESSEGWREQAFEKAVTFKMKGEEFGKKAISDAEQFSEDIKAKFADISSKVKGIQSDLEKVSKEEGEGGVKAGAALSALKDRLQDAKDSFKNAMKAKEEELKKRIDEAADAREKEGAEEKAEAKGEAEEAAPAPESTTAKKRTSKKRSTKK